MAPPVHQSFQFWSLYCQMYDRYYKDKIFWGLFLLLFKVEMKLENVHVSCKEIGMVKNKQTKAT